MSILSRPYFHDEAAAFACLEGLLWADGTQCPKCGTVGEAGKLEGVRSKASEKNPQGTERHGLWKCYACRQQFTVRVGTVFESAHIPLHKMLQAVYLLSSSKKGISAHQVHRALEITYKSAWFLCHRIREAMREGKVPQLGGEGKFVEIDETYIGGKEKNKHKHQRQQSTGTGGVDKEVAFALVERGGKVRTHHVTDVSAATLRPILEEQIHAATHVMSDMGGSRPAKMFEKHGMVNHSIGEYVRGEVSTNTVEGYFSILKRGIVDTYHHVSSQHLIGKREQIDAAIRAIKAIRSGGVSSPAAASPAAGPDQAITMGGPGEFLGMTIVDAAKALLTRRRKSLTNVEIAAAFKDGGLHLTSVDPVNTVGSVLTRRFNQVGDVVKIGRGTWGLKEWYPNRNFKKADKAASEQEGEAKADDDHLEVELESEDGGPAKVHVRERLRRPIA